MNTQPPPFPVRKTLNHLPPLALRMDTAIYFVTVCAQARVDLPFLDKAAILLESARHYQRTGNWFLHLFLVMPDHLHMLVQVPPNRTLTQRLVYWKRYLGRVHGIAFQRDYFETRIRDGEHFAEKWRYILYNPVNRGLVAQPRDWPHVISFNPATGEERQHRGPKPAPHNEPPPTGTRR